MMNNEFSFTASYINCAHNFKIFGIENACLKNDDTETGFACILLNILQRSNKSTRPSKYLLSKLGTYSNGEPFYLTNKCSTSPNWGQTIKGAENGFNPAYDFFYNYWPQYLPDFDWVRQHVLPEASMEIILQDFSGKWKNQSVDFYLPAAKLVIEIDGAQHADRLQTDIDHKRDGALKASGLTVIRFPVDAIKKQNDTFKNQIIRLKKQLTESTLVKADNQNTESKEYIIKIRYEQIIRYQILLLTLIKQNIISVHQNSWLFNIPKEMQQSFSLASEDLFLWFENLYILKKDTFKSPEVVFGTADEFITVENNVFSRKDDDTKINCISIFTDYYDDVDYFHVATNGTLIKYEIDWPVSTEQDKALKFTLLNLFDYNEFRKGQLIIIINALCLRDTIGILPTGGGKSLCYFFCSMLQPAPSYAVCPIISLLLDQEKNLREFGITRVTSISSLQNAIEKQKCINDFGDGRYLLIWTSPERFQNQEFRNCLQSANMNYMVSYAIIDEVHCLSEWGHDFRTSYLTLVDTIRTYTPQVTLFGLTATASQAVLTDLKVEFGIDASGVKAVHSLGRTNLSMKVRRTSDVHSKEDIFNKLISNESVLNKSRIGMVFSSTKNGKEGCINLLSKISSIRPDLRVDTFHADLDDKKKKLVQERFMDDDIDIITATKAFGMGINKPNVRYTIHYGMPMSIESFYQEAGRAGRDDKPSDCFIIYDPEQSSSSLDTLFMREVSNEALHSAQKAMQHDLNTLFFLWLSNNKGVKTDVKEIIWFINKYYNEYKQAKSFDFSCENHKQADVERALYHLKLLRVVLDWTIKQYQIKDKEAIIHIEILPFDETSIHKSFLDYIKKYDPLFEEEAGADRNKKYFDIINNPAATGKFLKSHVYALILWIYDHIGYTRRIAINNIRELCDRYLSDNNSEQFRRDIENYLKIDEKNGLLDVIADNPKDWTLWFEAFSDIFTNEGKTVIKPLTYDGYDSLRMVVARYIESYADNPGLNLIYLVSRALTNTFDNVVDYERLDNLVESLSNNSFFCDDMETFIHRLLITINEKKNNESVKLFSERICHYMPEYAEMIYNCLEDDYSLSTYLNGISNKIKLAIRGINI